MRSPRTVATLGPLLGSLALLGVVGCGDEQPPDRPEPSECDRYGTCDEIGPFGDGDYERWGDQGEQEPPEQPEQEDTEEAIEEDTPDSG